MAADAIVSAVVQKLISAATEMILHEIHLVRGVEKELLDISDKLKNVRYVLDDAEMTQFKDERVRDWLRRLEQTSYEMEEVLDEWDYATRQHEVESGSGAAPPPKHKVCSFIPSPCFCFQKLVVRRDIAQKIQSLKSKLDGILMEKDQLNFQKSEPKNDPSHVFQRVQTTSFMEITEFQGQNEDKNSLVNKLVASVGSGYQIHSLVGGGGLGKTTLAQLVYNDSRVKECFDLRIWICVSDPFDVVAIANKIIESVKLQSSSINELDVCLKILRDSISGKKFLLVLDDVWNEDDEKWKSLKIALKCGGAGSKILVTTRKEMVARIIGTADEDIQRPKLLSDEDCWLLLKRKAFSGTSQSESAFDEIGKKIAKKCNGLPLAALTLGSVLVSKNTIQEWDNVLKSEMWGLKKVGGELFPHLLLSYRELLPTHKRCFLFCAFFPKDTNIVVEELIGIWMALGYLGSNTKSNEEDMELKGREIFEDLAMRSIYQDFEKNDSTKQIRSCKMHDIVHDFARFLTNKGGAEASGMVKRTCQDCDSLLGPHVQEYPRLYWDKECPPHFCDCLTSLRVLQFKWKLESEENNDCPRGMEKLIHLRWMNIGGTRLSKEDLETICKLYFLQTLYLGNCSIKEIPTEIGNLSHLRDIDLSLNQIEVLPDSICSLFELRSLTIANCSLKKIPREIGNLNRLKNLDLSWNKELKELPESMGRLLGLQTLLLDYCSLEEIPGKIMNWVNLRHLGMRGNRELKRLPEEICSFLDLQTLDMDRCWNLCSLPEGLAQLPSISSLTAFLGGSGCGSIGLLKKLNNFHGSLHLMVQFSGGSDVEKLVRDAREAELRNKIHLQRLEISFRIINESNGAEEESSSSSSLSLWIDVIEALEPHDSLQSLQIWDYEGLRFPNWISSPLNRVRQIELIECCEVPPLGKLPFLEEVYVHKLQNLKVLRVEWLGIRGAEGEVIDVPLVAFPKLKRLSFHTCGEWCEWEDISADEEVSPILSLMPCLSELCIQFCARLKMLPHRLLRKVSALKVLDIRISPKLIQSYGDKEGSPWKSISQDNPRLQLKV